MSNVTLEEHQARVEQAERTLRGDLKQLGRWGRGVKQRVGNGRVLLLVGGAALLGILALRAAHRRRPERVMLPAAVRHEAPSLFGTALRMLLLEAARLAASRLTQRLFGGFEEPQVPRLAPPAAARGGGPSGA